MEILWKIQNDNTILVEVKDNNRIHVCVSMDNKMNWDIIQTRKACDKFYDSFQNAANLIMSNEYDCFDIANCSMVNSVLFKNIYMTNKILEEVKNKINELI